MASGNNSLRTLRSLISELKVLNRNDTKVSSTRIYQHIMEQYRKYSVTDEKLCLGRKEMQNMADTYLCYLTSTRKQKLLYDEYHGRGERSISESANLVGLRLPKLYEENKDRDN